MATDIRIVIKGMDEFSPAFSALDRDLVTVAAASRLAAGQVAELDRSFIDSVGSAGSAGRMVMAFAQSIRPFRSSLFPI